MCGRRSGATEGWVGTMLGEHSPVRCRPWCWGSTQVSLGLGKHSQVLGEAPSAWAPLPGCYPFYKTDPFVFPECPHVYFCGNTPSFGSKIIRGKFNLLAIPGFWAQGGHGTKGGICLQVAMGWFGLSLLSAALGTAELSQ